MSRLDIINDKNSQNAIKEIYEIMERRLKAGPSSNCPVEQSKAFLELCLSQSCGKCTPCRIGLSQVIKILEGILNGDGKETDIEEIKDLALSIKDSADCAIGFEAANSILCTIDRFCDDFMSHINKDRCTSKFDAIPCKGACPAHVDIPGYIALTKESRYDDAVRLIRYDNPFVSACALVCEHPCEFACRRNMIDDSINIRGIKRMAVDNAKDIKDEEILPSSGKKIAIIGGGPSGLTAAYFLSLMGHKCTVFEQRKSLGGMMRYGIPRYRLPLSYLDRDIQAILRTGVEVKLNTKVDKERFAKIKEEYDAVYISIGAHSANKLGIENEDAENVLSAVELLRRMGDNDKLDFTGKDVVIVGGGNVAMDCTRTAKRLNAKSVKCVYRRRQVDMTALEEEIEGAIAESCELITMKAPVRVEKDSEGKVKGLVVQAQIPSSYDRGRPKPIKADVDEETIDCDIIICAIGQKIDSSDFEDGSIITNRGRIVANSACKTDSNCIIYAGGDCLSGPSTIIRAVEAGKTAAANIDEELGFNTKLIRDIEIPNPQNQKYEKCGRINLSERPASDRKDDFDLMELQMTKQECMQECSRCLRCDHFGMGIVKGGRTSW